MNKEQIIQIARGAGARDFSFIEELLVEYEKARIAIIAATKEEDAMICEQLGKPHVLQSLSESIHAEIFSKQVSAAIRESKP